MILMIDNYDSFTYNVYQYIGSLYPQIQVVRNDEITIDEIRNLQNLEALVISPGPGYPDSAGISKEAIKTFGKEIPVLGICLGHQAIGEVYGGKVVPAKELMHGKMSEITINNKNPLFEGLEDKIYAARYHSLIIDDETFPEDLKVIGRDEKGQIMAVCHKEYPVYGIQFHPESILTEMGMRILENFLTNIAGIRLGDSKKEETMSAVNQETLKPFLTKIVEGNHLTEEEAYKAMDCIMSGNATDAQMGSFLTGLRMNHETPEELTGFAFNSCISVSRPAQNISTITPISATLCIKLVSVRIPSIAGPRRTPARSAPTTCGICTFLVARPSALVQSKIIARSSKYL